MSTETGTALQLSRVIKADRETVFKAWTEAEHLRRWSCPEGIDIADVQVDLSVGGAFQIRMLNPEGQTHTAYGTYREIERPRRLVYTWDWREDDQKVGETLVTVEFNALGDSTEVVLTHERFPSAEAKSEHEKGWSSCLNRLEALFA